MRCSKIIFGLVTCLALLAPVRLWAQIQKPSDSPPVQGSSNPSPGATSPVPPASSNVSVGDPAAAKDRQIDGVAARIEDDIITESEVRELAAFQNLVDGKAKSRDELLRELALLRGEEQAELTANGRAGGLFSRLRDSLGGR